MDEAVERIGIGFVVIGVGLGLIGAVMGFVFPFVGAIVNLFAYAFGVVPNISRGPWVATWMFFPAFPLGAAVLFSGALLVAVGAGVKWFAQEVL